MFRNIGHPGLSAFPNSVGDVNAMLEWRGEFVGNIL